MAIMAVLLLLTVVTITVGFVIPATRIERRRMEVSGKLSGLVFQIIGDIAKLRVTGAEGRA